MKDGSKHLYDLQEDPDEWNNLASNAKYKDLIKGSEKERKQMKLHFKKYEMIKTSLNI